MKVVIAGAGIAGNAMLRHLRHLRQHRDVTEVKAYKQRSLEDASPPGLNALLNHSALAVTREVDPELYAAFQSIGSKMVASSARTVTGEILYHLEDAVEDAHTAALVARWDDIHEATRCDNLTEYSVAVVDVVEEEGSDKLSVKIEAESGQIEWISNEY